MGALQEGDLGEGAAPAPGRGDPSAPSDASQADTEPAPEEGSVPDIIDTEGGQRGPSSSSSSSSSSSDNHTAVGVGVGVGVGGALVLAIVGLIVYKVKFAGAGAKVRAHDGGFAVRGVGEAGRACGCGR